MCKIKLAEKLAERYDASMAKKADFRLFYSETRARAGRAAWILNIPAAFSADGRKKQRAFHTERQARAALRDATAARRQLGEQANLLPGRDDLAALAVAESTIAPFGLTLQNAATFTAICMQECGSLSHALMLMRWAASHYKETPWPVITLKEAIDQYQTAATHLARATKDTRRYAFAALYKHATLYCENTNLSDITPANLRPVLDAAPLTLQMRGNVYKCLRALFTWAAEQALMPPANPMATIRPPVIQEAEIHPLTPPQLAALLRAAQPYPDAQRYLALCAFAGIRPTEATRLTWSDLSPDEPIISVRSKSSKTGGARHITIRPVLAAWLAHTAPAKPPAPSAPLCPVTRRILRRIKEQANLSGAAWQADVLRHSFASYALKAGTSLADLQLDMGHRDASMLRARYLNMAGLTRTMADTYWALTPATVLTH